MKKPILVIIFITLVFAIISGTAMVLSMQSPNHSYDNVSDEMFGATLMPSQREISEDMGVYLSIEDAYIFRNTNRVSITFNNQTDYGITFGLYLAIEKYQNGEWYRVVFDKEMQTLLLSLSCCPNETATEHMNIAPGGETHRFSPGKYRIISAIELHGASVTYHSIATPPFQIQ